MDARIKTKSGYPLRSRNAAPRIVGPGFPTGSTQPLKPPVPAGSRVLSLLGPKKEPKKRRWLRRITVAAGAGSCGHISNGETARRLRCGSTAAEAAGAWVLRSRPPFQQSCWVKTPSWANSVANWRSARKDTRRRERISAPLKPLPKRPALSCRASTCAGTPLVPQGAAGEKGTGPSAGATIPPRQSCPRPGKPIFAYFFWRLAKSKASGGTRPADFGFGLCSCFRLKYRGSLERSA